MTESIIPPNALRRILASGRRAAGTMLVEVRQPAVLQWLANGGLDFVLIDSEHGPFSVETLAELSRAAVLVGITPIVRVPVIAYEQITRALDGGAQGVMLPRVRSRDEVREALAMMKYPPDGRRGSVLSRGHTQFRAGPLVEALAAANRETMLVVQVETREAVERLDDLLGVPGVDAALIGPTDLSVALGVSGRLEDPVLVAAIEATIEACGRHGVIPAIHLNDVRLAAHWAGRGMRMVSVNSEAGYVIRAATEAAAAVRG